MEFWILRVEFHDEAGEGVVAFADVMEANGRGVVAEDFGGAFDVQRGRGVDIAFEDGITVESGHAGFHLFDQLRRFAFAAFP